MDERFLHPRDRPVVVAQSAVDQRQEPQGEADAGVVAMLPRDLQRRFAGAGREIDIVLLHRQPAGHEVDGGAQVRRQHRLPLRVEGGLHPDTALGEHAPEPPVAPQRLGEPGVGDGIAELVEGGERGAHIGQVGVDPVGPRCLVRPGEAWRGPHRLFKEDDGVAAAHLPQLVGHRQPLHGVMAHRFQQEEARLVGILPRALDEALVVERDEVVEGLELAHRRVGIVGADDGGRLGRDVPVEHPQPAEGPLLALVEEVVAPADGVADGPLVLRAVGRTAGQEREGIRQSLEQGLGREDLQPGGRQLDREGQAVEPGADGGDRSRVLRRHGERRAHLARAIDEERHALDAAELLRRERGVRIRHGEGRQRVFVLAREVQDLPAGRQDRQLAAGHEQAGQERDRQQLLEVVQHEQHLPLAGVVDDARFEGFAGDGEQPELAGDNDGHALAVPQRGERDDMHAVREVVANGLGGHLGEAGLADAGRAGQGEQAHAGVAQERGHGRDMLLTPDERGEHGYGHTTDRHGVRAFRGPGRGDLCRGGASRRCRCTHGWLGPLR